MEPIEFKNPVFPGAGEPFTTVRRGTKWAEKLGKGDQVQLCGVGGTIVGFGRVVDTTDCPFNQLPQSVLQLEHDPGCRTKKGLLSTLRDCYDGFEPAEQVTVLTIEVEGTVEDGPEPEPEGAGAAGAYAEELGLSYGDEEGCQFDGGAEGAATTAPAGGGPKDAQEAAQAAVNAARAVLDGYFGLKGKSSRRPRALAYQTVGRRLLDLSNRITG